MTLIMWEQAIDQVVIFTDTLVSGAQPPHVPLGFTSKVHPLPHLNLALATTGSVWLLDTWHYWIARNLQDAESIDDLDEPATEVLRELRDALTGTETFRSLNPGHTDWDLGAVYHFGIDPTGRAVSHWFRAEDDYVPELHCEDMPMQFVAPDLRNGPRTFTNLADAIDVACFLKGNGMPGIGGELYRTVLRDGEVSHQRVHVFDDYDQVAETIRRDVPGYIDALVESVKK